MRRLPHLSLVSSATDQLLRKKQFAARCARYLDRRAAGAFIIHSGVLQVDPQVKPISGAAPQESCMPIISSELYRWLTYAWQSASGSLGEGIEMRRANVVPLVALLLCCGMQQLVAEQPQCGKDVNGTLCPNPTYCCSQYGYCGTSDLYCVTGCQSGPCHKSPTPPPPPAPPLPPSPPPPPRPSVSPTPSTGAGTVITRKLFETLYPDYNKTFYSYDAFIVAARAFPKFLNEGCRDDRLRELAAFSAHVQQETGGLFYVEEIDQSNSYCDPTATLYPCAPYQKYFGRGPLQLSWNFNYGPASAVLKVDILKRPFLVSFDPVLAFKASFWFWNTPRDGIPSIHDVILGKHKLTKADKAANRKNGFGYTINIINGGLECGKGTATPQAANRVKYYQQFCKLLNVSTGPNLDCTNQKSFA